MIHFIGLKGQFIMEKSKAQAIAYEVRAQIPDHAVVGKDEVNRAHMGM